MKIIIIFIVFPIYIECSNIILQNIFTEIYKKNLWNNAESVSGPGSTLQRTGKLRQILPEFFSKYYIKSILDAPCGDFNWMKEIIYKFSFEKYIGADIVQELININKNKFILKNINFICLDLINDELPKVDLIFCRDCFIHFSKEDIVKTIKNFKKSGSKYLLMTNFKSNRLYIDINTGDFRPLNLKLPPFNLPEPIDEFDDNENYHICFNDKYLGLWKLEELNI